ncbi:response regulator transcription factor [Hydrogenophaga sp.]|uniref:response regulator n=1 Tax=Hydrogenophaga sp. TaxID=1904254 RepID=UPI0026124B37|nr:response regulator transcription factor [Hydrogenophaga sp.]MCW5654869.1 response regulator transcription factor [Hydrogenophaga sp.]
MPDSLSNHTPVSGTPRCILVDDDEDIRHLLGDYLRGFGMSVELLADGAALRERLPRGEVDVLLLDLMLPGESGLALCQWVRQMQPGLPVIMLTAQGDVVSRVLGLELGADDYLPKPFEPRELVARIKAVLRRGGLAASGASAAEVHFRGWVFDRLRRQLAAPDGTLVALSAAEHRLLVAFTDHPGQVLSRERLLDITRAPGVEVSERSIDLAVSRLRGKLREDEGRDGDPPLIRTLRGAGYLFDPLGRRR